LSIEDHTQDSLVTKEGIAKKASFLKQCKHWAQRRESPEDQVTEGNLEVIKTGG
jgi:hypothetical protein